MTTQSDPSAVVLSDRVYRALLRVYPRRFRLQYHEEMAMVFRDSCRDAYQRDGGRGLIAVWKRGITDLGHNVPKEMNSTLLEQVAQRPIARSCSGCNNEVLPTWPRCLYCGSFLTTTTTYPTRTERVRHSLQRDAESLGDVALKAPPPGPM